jgi:hypothetical protein
MEDLRYHKCDKAEQFALIDARGIFCCYVCDKCKAAKMTKYRPEIFTDPNYWHDEPIDIDDET